MIGHPPGHAADSFPKAAKSGPGDPAGDAFDVARSQETLERQHQLQDVHVIVMSGFLDRDDCERLEGKGLRVLRKPFDVEAFLAEIRALIPVA